jgi:hypothetical protein
MRRSEGEKEKSSGRVTSNADKLLCAGCNQLLLEQASTTTLDAVQVVVNLVSTIKSNIQHDVLGQTVETHGHQTCLLDDLSRLETSGDEEDVATILGRVLGQAVLDSLDTVDDCASRTDADKLHVRVEVVGDGAVGGLALGLLDHVDGSSSNCSRTGCSDGHVAGGLVCSRQRAERA